MTLTCEHSTDYREKDGYTVEYVDLYNIENGHEKVAISKVRLPVKLRIKLAIVIGWYPIERFTKPHFSTCDGLIDLSVTPYNTLHRKRYVILVAALRVPESGTLTSEEQLYARGVP